MPGLAPKPSGEVLSVFYCWGPLDPIEGLSIDVRIAEIKPTHVILRRLIGTADQHPKFGEAIETAREAGAKTILIPNDKSLGPISYAPLLNRLLPSLQKAEIRLRCVLTPEFDTANETFLYGVFWAAESVKRRRSTDMVQWHEEKKEAGERTGRKYHPPCICRHRVTRLGGEGHNLLNGVIGPCRARSCGCAIYRPINEVLLGKGNRGDITPPTSPPSTPRRADIGPPDPVQDPLGPAPSL